MSFSELIFGPGMETIRRHPECFQLNGADPVRRQRTIPMEVLSLGMSRTGTASMHAALTCLGFETYHGFRAFADIRDYELWNPAYETKYFNRPSSECPKVDGAFFDKVLGHIGAVTDMPPASFALELLQAYPGAKVVLVERNEDEWYRSFQDVFVKTYENPIVKIMAWLDPKKAGQLIQFLTRGVAEGQFRAQTAEEFRFNARSVYREHYASIRKYIQDQGQESRLLEYQLGSGWVPLCQFLGKPVPESVKFPKVNETAMIQEKIRVMMIVGTRRHVARMLKFMLPILLVMGAWHSLRCR